MKDQTRPNDKPQGVCHRQTILIKKNLQYRYMALIILSVLAGFLMVGLELVWSFSYVFGKRPVLVEPLLAELAPMLRIMGVKVAIYLAIVMIVSGLISHLMAGPIYKIEKSLGVIGEGDLTYEVYLRKHDQMTDLRDAVNAMTCSLRGKVSDEREKAQKLKAELEQLAAESGNEELKKRLAAAAAAAGEINATFKI